MNFSVEEEKFDLYVPLPLTVAGRWHGCGLPCRTWTRKCGGWQMAPLQSWFCIWIKKMVQFTCYHQNITQISIGNTKIDCVVRYPFAVF